MYEDVLDVALIRPAFLFEFNEFRECSDTFVEQP